MRRFNKTLTDYVEDVKMISGGMEVEDNFIGVVVGKAMSLWEEVPDDFCIQHATYDAIVFGAVNRVVWRSDAGFSCEGPSYCTKRFIEHYKEVMGVG